MKTTKMKRTNRADVSDIESKTNKTNDAAAVSGGPERGRKLVTDKRLWCGVIDRVQGRSRM